LCEVVAERIEQKNRAAEEPVRSLANEYESGRPGVAWRRGLKSVHTAPSPQDRDGRPGTVVKLPAEAVALHTTAACLFLLAGNNFFPGARQKR
jgi:hypothetical protein